MVTIITLYISAVIFILVSIYINVHKENKDDRFLFYITNSVIFLSITDIALATGLIFLHYYPFAYAIADIAQGISTGYILLLSFNLSPKPKSYNVIVYVTVLIYIAELLFYPISPLRPIRFHNIYSYGQEGVLGIYGTVITLTFFIIIVVNFLRFALSLKNDIYERNKFITVALGIFIASVSIGIEESVPNTYTAIIGNFGYLVGSITALILLSNIRRNAKVFD
jgi:hypothetical protein